MKKDLCLEKLLDLLEEGIHVIDSKGRTVIYNRKMADLEKMGPGEVLGQDLLHVFPSLSEESSNLLQTLRSGRGKTASQQEYYNKFGQQITTINSTYPLHFEDGSRWALEIARDITLIRELYSEILSLSQNMYHPSSPPKERREHYMLEDIVSDHLLMKNLVVRASKAAATNSPVLIYGETGTGKELFAQGIHYASHRCPFIAQNCAALPEQLLEGILFGTRKGGFTGAINRKGLFAQASGGTLLLDEIHTLPIGLQAKLLRVLEEGRIRPLGSEEEIQIDVRILTTMNIPPKEALERGELREDLYYRLAVVYLPLPPLRKRREDISLLTHHFIEEYNQQYSLQVRGVDPEVFDLFYHHPWPGNVRQLKHTIEGAMNQLDREDWIQRKDIGSLLEPIKRREKMSLNHRLEELEKDLIQEALDVCNGNITHAAERLGLKRQGLQYRMKKYHLFL